MAAGFYRKGAQAQRRQGCQKRFFPEAHGMSRDTLNNLPRLH